MADSLKLAVVTGGHSYDVPNFHRLFREMDADIEPCLQHMDDYASSSSQVRREYDVVLFYIMLMDGPTDDGHPWYAGKPLTALAELGQTSQGIVVLHHAILAYPQWPTWAQLTGITARSFGYYFGETVTSHIVDSLHPITRGLSDWTMPDETYTMPDAGEDSHLLITYDHPRSMRTIAWTRRYGQARVFNYQAGHDNDTWQDASFREVLRRGIRWAGGKL